jgi:dephospho-CoA kinase
MSFAFGIVGAIASGKSTAARWFAARGWTVVDADAEAHALYAPGSPLVASLADRFGSGILLADGTVDRAALGKIVFGDPQALRDLDALVHPLARARIWTAVDRALAREESVVLEMALLYRWPEMVARLDSILGIRCADPIRLERLVERSGLARDQARRRLLAQDETSILSVAARLVSNEGPVADLGEALENLTV